MFLKNIIICFILILNLNFVFSIPNKNYNDNKITLIVDPFSNRNFNNYKSGEKCGDNYNRCKSINDAISYFNTIAIPQPNNNKLSFQQLNLKLADGIYSNLEDSFNLLEFNIKIEPLIKNSKVIFDGSNSKINNKNNALFYVDPISTINKGINYNNNNNNKSILSSITISDITFQSFFSTIIKIDNQNDENYNSLIINNCIFINYTSSHQKVGKYGSPLIYMLSTSSPSINEQKQQLIINNSIFKSSNLFISLWKTNLIHIENTKSIMNNNEYYSLNGLKGLSTLIYSRFNSDISINSNSFHDIITTNGLINIDNSKIQIMNSNFKNIIGDNFGSVLYFSTSSTLPSFTFIIENCNFINCTNNYCSGVLNVFGINNGDQNYIQNCNFINNQGPDSSILTSQTIDITIQNSNLKSTNSHGGSLLLYTSNLLIESCHISDEINDNSIIDSGRIQTKDGANLKMMSNTFGDNNNNKFKILCDNSNINLQNNFDLIPSFDCNQCLDFTINGNSVC
ncbi:hypothetical protein ACTA71_006482 [Dictyostelium dimigraforme]